MIRGAALIGALTLIGTLALCTTASAAETTAVAVYGTSDQLRNRYQLEVDDFGWIVKGPGWAAGSVTEPQSADPPTPLLLVAAAAALYLDLKRTAISVRR